MALLLGLGLVVALLWAARAFSRASVAGIKALLWWVAGLAGLSVAALLVLSGRGMVAVSGLVLLGPLAWSYWQEGRGRAVPGGAAARSSGRMTRAEALAVLGLGEGASDEEVRAAWVRLMRGAHPDGGGSDWLAARVNEAKEVLLRRR